MLGQADKKLTIEEVNTLIQQTEEKINQIQSLKQQTHELAEAKREFGLSEDGVEIKNLQENWELLNEEYIKLEKTLSNLQEKREEIIKSKERYLGIFSCTAYINPNNNRTANGGTTIPYKTIAVDPKVIPLGSKLKVRRIDTGDTYEVIANDTGGVVKGNIVDLYIGNYNDAIQWGRRNVEIWIIKD